MASITGGELVARMLAAEGVDTVFGIVDGSYAGLNFALPGNDIRLVSPRHESSAAHMAGAYARVTGRLGVCIASNGPGVANALPGVAVEQTEGNRVLLITSSRRHAIVHPDRDRLQAALSAAAIDSAIYYPRPLHQQPAYEEFHLAGTDLGRTEQLCNGVLSLPMHPYLPNPDIDRVIETVRNYA